MISFDEFGLVSESGVMFSFAYAKSDRLQRINLL